MMQKRGKTGPTKQPFRTQKKKKRGKSFRFLLIAPALGKGILTGLGRSRGTRSTGSPVRKMETRKMPRFTREGERDVVLPRFDGYWEEKVMRGIERKGKADRSKRSLTHYARKKGRRPSSSQI